MQIQEEQEIAIKFNAKVSLDIMKKMNACEEELFQLKQQLKPCEEELLELKKKITHRENELEELAKELAYRERVCAPYFTPGTSNVKPSAGFPSKRGPMSKEAVEHRTKQTLEVLNANGGVDVPIKVIAKGLGISKDATLNWLERQISNKQAAWHHGKDLLHYSLNSPIQV
jgi:hypothetical protein